MTAEVLSLAPGRSDAEIAKELRDRLAAALGPVCEACDEAAKAGMKVGFTLGPDFLGKTKIASLSIVKEL